MTAVVTEASSAWDHEVVHAAVGLKAESGRTFLSARTQRHLFGKVVEAAITQEDHLEEEETSILPILRRRVGAQQQLEKAKRLLIDQESADNYWMLDWLSQHLTAKEQQLLMGLLARLTTGAHQAN